MASGAGWLTLPMSRHRRASHSPHTGVGAVYDEVYLHHISVIPTYRRRGVGTALLSAVVEAGTVLGISRVALDVWRVNAPARAVFKAHGFAPYK